MGFGKQIASLFATIGADTKGLEKGLTQTKTGLGGVIKGFASALGPAALLTTAATLLAKGFKAASDTAQEAAVINAKVEAVIRATGGAANLSVGEIDRMSNALSKLSGVDDELIKNASAVMLTFVRIGEEVFPKAMQAAMDMSAVMGTDLQGAVVMIGKAMNVAEGDVTGASTAMSALKRVGVAFTTDQIELAKQLIAAGDAAGYQKLILGELNSEFGGTAEAMEDATTGSGLMKTSWGNLLEVVGKGLIPTQREWNLLLADTFDLLTEGISASNRHEEAVTMATKALVGEQTALYINTHFWLLNLEALERVTTQIEIGMLATEHWTAWLDGQPPKIAEVTNAMDELAIAEAEAIAKVLSFSENFGGMVTYAEKYTDVQAEIAAKQAEINALSAGFNLDGTAISAADAKTKIDELNGGIKELQGSLTELANKVISDMLMATISINGVTEAEAAAYFDFAVKTGQMSREAADAAVALYADAMAQVRAIYDGIPKDITTTVHLNYEEGPRPSTISGGLAVPRASGGSVSSWAWVGEEGPELIHAPGATVYSHQQSERMMSIPKLAGGGVIPVTAPAGDVTLSYSTIQELARVLRDSMLQVAR